MVFVEICRALERPVVDRFTTSLNHKLLVCVSPLPDPQACKEDMFLISWDHLQAYAFSPLDVIRSVLYKVIVSDSLSLGLVAPLWLHRGWFSDFLSLLVAEPLELPRFWNLLVQPPVRKFHQGLEIINHHAWNLSSISSERQAFQRRLHLRGLPTVRETTMRDSISNFSSVQVVTFLLLVSWQGCRSLQGLCFEGS